MRQKRLDALVMAHADKGFLASHRMTGLKKKDRLRDLTIVMALS